MFFHVALMMPSLISAVGGHHDGDGVSSTFASSSLARPLLFHADCPAAEQSLSLA
jgi:hypothetical protein